MKIIVTGGNRGLGLAICQHYQASSYSRHSGYDITNPANREQLADISLECDIFINNAFDGPFHEPWADFGQCKLLHKIATIWQAKQKSGIIINIGSIGSENIIPPEPHWETYRIAKLALKGHSQQWSRAFKENLVSFRTSLLTIDRLDTPLSRERSNWTGNGIDPRDIISCIDFIINCHPNTCIEEIIAWVNLDYKH